MKYINKKGFTLIELLAIIVILAVIMAIAIPQVLNVVNGSKSSAWKDNIKMMAKSIELNTQLFDAETGNYTYTVDSLCKNPGKVNEISKSSDTTVTCSNGVFSLVGTGQFSGHAATINCSSGNCVTTFVEGGASGLPAVSFATDPWETIVANVKAGNVNAYAPTNQGVDKQVLRKVDLGELGKHYLRVANTTPCTNGETSETACGFVIEFADIISMKQTNTTDTNVGGYPATNVMFNYVTNTVYNALPLEIRNSIINTTVVSGHGPKAGESNFTTPNQKLYLLSRQEVFGDNSSNDTAASTTKKLDYYSLNNINANRIKKYQDDASLWWLRSAAYYNNVDFISVNNIGTIIGTAPSSTYGVSPAFRIG